MGSTSVFITGATGYIGSRLAARTEAERLLCATALTRHCRRPTAVGNLRF